MGCISLTSDADYQGRVELGRRGETTAVNPVGCHIVVCVLGRIHSMVNRPASEDLRCSFCNKSQSEVRKLIAGPTVFICDECVDVCRGIIADDNQMQTSDDAEPPLPLPKGALNGPPVQCALCGTLVPCSDVVPVPHRGVVCLGCAGEVEAAIAERRQSES